MITPTAIDSTAPAIERASAEPTAAPATSSRSGVLGSSAGYFIAQGAVMLGGFVTMPLLTRLLSKEEYGLLSLVLASVGMLAMIGRLGFPQTATRYYAEENQRGAQRLREFCDHIIGGALGASALTALAAAAICGWVTAGSDANYVRSMRLACLIVVTRVLLSVLYQIYRAQERVLAYSVAVIVARFSTIGLAVAFLLLSGRTAYQVILATAAAEMVVGLVCLAELAARGVIRLPRISWSATAAAFSYGVPLTASSSASFVLDYGDRFLIGRFLGLDAVASYSVPYDLSQNVAAALLGPVNLAVVPIVLRVWARDGQAAAADLLSRLTTYLFALAIPVVALLLILNHELIVLLASWKYSASSMLTPYLLPGIFLGELNFLFVMGIMIGKKTIVLAVITFLAGVLNVALNLVLIPRWGLIGAGVATTASFVALMAVTYLRSRTVLALRLDYAVIGKAIIVAAIVSALLVTLGPRSPEPLIDLLVRGTTGVLTVAACMWLLDPGTRSILGSLRRR